MSKKTIIWSLILFILMPIAYIYATSALEFILKKHLTRDYIFFAICIAVIIIINVLAIKEISKKK